MDRSFRLLSCLLLAASPLVSALKFDLHPVSSHDAAKYERCVRNFVAKDQLVVVTAILDGYRGDGQRVDMHVRCLLDPSMRKTSTARAHCRNAVMHVHEQG